jgi:hypothetical protein
MVDDFVDEIEETYGKYKSGMRKAITDKLFNIDKQDEQKLLKNLIENYDMARPPNLKIILEVMYKIGITLLSQGYGGMSICEHCNYEFDQALVRCPKCDKLRIYGVTRLYKMGEGKMHPFEIKERADAMKAQEPTAEEMRKFNEYLSHTGGLRGLLKGKIKNLRQNKSR